MISNNILQDISNESGIDKYSVLREIIQVSFLEELYKLQISKKIYFKGGTAIKILFASNRYSEDLDFTTDLDDNEINKSIDTVVHQLNKEYQSITVKSIDTIAGISKKLSLPVEISSQPLTIKLDFSQRESVIDPRSGTIFTKLPVTTSSVIQHLSDEEILAEKYRAIINRDKGRDLYDFLFLLKRGVNFNHNIVNEKLKYYNEIYNPNDFINKVKAWDEIELDKDIRKFLPLNERDIINELKNILLKKFNEIKH